MAYIDADPGFTILPPDPPHSPVVAEFFADNPEFNVTDNLAFLAEHYPDTSSWIVEGGVAVQALTGRRESPPGDIDVICRDRGMEADFGHSDGFDPSDRRYIDVKTTEDWLQRKRVVESGEPSLWDYVLASSLSITIDGFPVHVMHPALIAAGKSTLFQGLQRPKDISDVALL